MLYDIKLMSPLRKAVSAMGPQILHLYNVEIQWYAKLKYHESSKNFVFRMDSVDIYPTDDIIAIMHK